MKLNKIAIYSNEQRRSGEESSTDDGRPFDWGSFLPSFPPSGGRMRAARQIASNANGANAALQAGAGGH